jgi:arginyl-tRNA synthetase
VVDHEQPVAEPLDVAQVVRRQHHRDAVLAVDLDEELAHARIAGILRNAGDDGASNSVQLAQPLAPEERELVKRLAELPAVAAEAAARRGPQAVPVYAIRVADDFHRFYHEHRVLESEQRDFRLALCRAAQRVIARCLDLVGVEAPERM